jgi:hypothetical protein
MKEAERNLHPQDFHDISNALDAYPGTAFIDTIHSTELANEMIARAIVANIQ